MSKIAKPAHGRKSTIAQLERALLAVLGSGLDDSRVRKRKTVRFGGRDRPFVEVWGWCFPRDRGIPERWLLEAAFYELTGARYPESFVAESVPGGVKIEVGKTHTDAEWSRIRTEANDIIGDLKITLDDLVRSGRIPEAVNREVLGVEVSCYQAPPLAGVGTRTTGEDSVPIRGALRLLRGRISDKTIRRAIGSGSLRATKDARGRWRVDRASLGRWAEAEHGVTIE